MNNCKMVRIGFSVIILVALLSGMMIISPPQPVAAAEDVPSLDWVRQFGGTENDSALDMAADSTGIYVVGETSSSFMGQDNLGSSDAFIVKYDVCGNVVWANQFGTSEIDEAHGVAVDSTGIYVVGLTSGSLTEEPYLGGAYDVFLKKYNLDGTEGWTVQFGTSAADYAGGVAVDSLGGVYIAGDTQGAFEGTNIGLSDAYLVKYGTDGTQLWVRQFGTISTDDGQAVAADSTGVYIVGGTYGELVTGYSTGGGDGYIRKYSLDGTEGWTVQFGTDASFNPVTIANAVAIGSSGLYVVGDAEVGEDEYGAIYDAFIRKFSITDGSLIWTDQFGSTDDDYGRAVTVDSSGIYVAGETDGDLAGTLSGYSDTFVSKYDAGGNQLWTSQLSADGNDYAYGAAVDSAGGVCVAGEIYGTFPGQPDIGNQTGYRDGFIARYGDSIECAPAIISSNTVTFTAGVSKSFKVVATGYPKSTISISGDSVSSSGISFTDNEDNTATLSGTPAVGSGGTYNLTLSATNTLGTDTQNFTLYINEAPKITSADNTTFTVGVNGSFTIQTSGSPKPAIELYNCVLPSGVIFKYNGDGTATLSGVPAVGSGGIYTPTLEASNIFGSDSQYFTLTVNEAPQFNNGEMDSTYFTVGEWNSFTIEARGYPEATITRTDSVLLPGITWDENTDTFSGIAESTGEYSLTFTASNGVSPDATQNFTLTIVDLRITQQSKSMQVVAGSTASFTVNYVSYPEVNIQWQYSDSNGRKWYNVTDGVGANTSTYTTSAVTTRMNGYLYKANIFNDDYSLFETTVPVTLDVLRSGTASNVDMKVTKSDGIYDPVTKTIAWEITVTNEGPDTAQGVKVTDALVSGTQYSSITGATAKVGGRTVTVNIGTLNSNETRTFTIYALVTKAISPVQNSVTVSTTSFEQVPGNNTDTGTCSW